MPNILPDKKTTVARSCRVREKRRISCINQNAKPIQCRTRCQVPQAAHPNARQPPQGLATATVPCTALSCQSCRCRHPRVAPQYFFTSTAPCTAQPWTSCNENIFALRHKISTSTVFLHRTVVPILQVHASSRCIARFGHRHGACTAQSCQSCRCKHRRAALQDASFFCKHGVFHSALHREVVPI